MLEPDIPVPSPKLPSLLSLSGRSLPSPAPSTMGPLSLYLSTQPPHLQPVVPSPKMKAETTELLSDSLHGIFISASLTARLMHGYRPPVSL